MVDRDGIAKPAILLIVEEALDAGIEEVVIVVQEQDLEDFRSFFTEQISIENYNKLPRPFQEYACRLLEIRPPRPVRHPDRPGRPRPRGVLRPRRGGRRAFSPDARGPPLPRERRRLVRPASDRRLPAGGHSVVGLPRPTPESEIGSFGVATGVWVETDRRLNVTEFAEKPGVDYARAHLRVPGVPEGEYLTVFGRYRPPAAALRLPRGEHLQQRPRAGRVPAHVGSRPRAPGARLPGTDRRWAPLRHRSAAPLPGDARDVRELGRPSAPHQASGNKGATVHLANLPHGQLAGCSLLNSRFSILNSVCNVR